MVVYVYCESVLERYFTEKMDDDDDDAVKRNIKKNKFEQKIE